MPDAKTTGTGFVAPGHPVGQGGQAPPGVAGCVAAVKIGRVVRGNPFVSSGARDAGLPDSLPPGKTCEVTITVTPPLDPRQCAGQFIELRIAGAGGDAGSATITPDRITATTKVTIKGVTQTKHDVGEKAKFGAKLTIQATLNGKLVAESGGFSVAHPINWYESFNSNIDDQLQGKHAVGAYVNIRCDSDSGTFGDLSRGVYVKELLDHREKPKEPPFDNYPFDHSDYQLATALGTDRYAILKPLPEPDSTWTHPQLSIFKCLRCGCVNVPHPHSGSHILFIVKSKKFCVRKVPARVTIDGKSVEAGTFRGFGSPEVDL